MLDRFTIDFRCPYPVFPLPHTVLLPNTLLPLHIFEGRYRKMVQDSLDSFGMVGMATFAEPVSEEEYLKGRPRLRPCVGLGHILQYEPLEDGRFLLLLQGLCRTRITRELPSAPYRKVLLEPFDTDETDETYLDEYRQRIEFLVTDKVLQDAEISAQIKTNFDKTVPTSIMVDRLGDAFLNDGDQRYAFLAAADPAVRARRLIRHIETLKEASDAQRYT